VVSLSPFDGGPRTCSVRADDGTFQDLQAPSSSHWFGTDAQGCDVFTRVVYGARMSLVVGAGGGLLAALLGTALGVLAAVRGGWADAAVRRTADVLMGIPFVVGAILLLSVVARDDRGARQLVATLAVLSWPATARMARTSARGVLALSYVEAARACGCSTLQVVRRHVLPNSLPPVIAFTSLGVGSLIAAEATLTYLGIGLSYPSVSWGLMIDEGQRSGGQHPHLIVFPSLFLTLTVLAFVLLGNALRDSLDTQSHVSMR
jgi:ABC-type dipeptide/oligopeptide/nickel transport system permease subunit